MVISPTNWLIYLPSARIAEIYVLQIHPNTSVCGEIPAATATSESLAAFMFP